MTDDLRERVAKALCDADDGGNVDIIFKAAVHVGDCTNDPWTCAVCQKEHYYTLADTVLAFFQPGDVLPNGWVAPDDASDRMIEALWEDNADTAWQAMRAAAIRGKEG